jgi:hypothetical protein
MDDREIAHCAGDDYLYQTGCHNPVFQRAVNCFLCDASYASVQNRIRDYGSALRNGFCNESLGKLRDGLAEDLIFISQRTALHKYIESSSFDKSACLKHQKARIENLDLLLIEVDLVWQKHINDDTGRAIYSLEIVPAIGTIPMQ